MQQMCSRAGEDSAWFELNPDALDAAVRHFDSLLAKARLDASRHDGFFSPGFILEVVPTYRALITVKYWEMLEENA